LGNSEAFMVHRRGFGDAANRQTGALRPPGATQKATVRFEVGRFEGKFASVTGHIHFGTRVA
jgi:hypothetical protein